jgi:chromosomal replication initiator protein
MVKNHVDIWNSCLGIISDNIPAASYRTWFQPIVPLKLERNVLTIQVPSPFFYEYLEEQYIDLLRKTLRKELGPEAKLEYSVIMEKSSTNPTIVNYPTSNPTQLKNRPVSMNSTAPVDSGIKNPFILPGIRKLNIDPRLNPNHTFANFIEGEGNRLARAAAYAVAANPGGTSFNPYLIYGNNGLGKTHLAQAIGIEVKEKMPEKVVLYLTANMFQTQFTDATRKNNRNDFVHFYQMIDVLIIDDVHEFAGKGKTQDVFFHIFNHLHQNGKQLILTCDKPPAELEGLESRLLSRFKWGLSAQITAPDYETRKEILKKKLYNDGINLREDIIDYIAGSVTTNVRELEGLLISLLAQITLVKRELTLEMARGIIDNLIKNTHKDVTIDLIMNEVSVYFNMPVESLQQKTRKQSVVQARQIAMYLSKKHTESSLAAIGSKIGNKDHATVLYACKQVENFMYTDKKFKRYIDEIEEKLVN